MAGPLTRAESYTMILGGNEITQVDAALVLEKEEVCRVHEDDAGRQCRSPFARKPEQVLVVWIHREQQFSDR